MSSPDILFSNFFTGAFPIFCTHIAQNAHKNTSPITTLVQLLTFFFSIRMLEILSTEHPVLQRTTLTNLQNSLWELHTEQCH